MRVLLTGADGLIGAATARALASTDAEIVTSGRAADTDAPCDLTVPGEAHDLVARARPDRVIHLAWVGDDRIANLANLDWVGHTAALLRACVESDVTHVVTAGTCFEYEVATSALLEAGTTLEAPTTLYGAAKLSVGHMVRGLDGAGAMAGAHARIFYVYGPGEYPPRLVPTVGLGLLRDEAVATTDGTQRRDFVFVDDVGSALATLSVSGASGTFDIASGTAVAIGDLIDGLESRIATGRVDRGALPQREGDPEVIVGSPASMASLGWGATVNLDEGLDRSVEWMRLLKEQGVEQ